MESDSDSDQAPSTPKRRNYDLKFKLDAVDYAEKHNKRKAAREFNVTPSRIREWTGQKSDLQNRLDSTPSGKSEKRLKGAGRHLKDEDFDKEMINWIHQQRSVKIRVTLSMIQNKALKSSTDPEFKASNGWLEKFLNRHKLVNRRPTTVCQKEPSEYQQLLVDYILFVSKMRRKSNYPFIFAADETAVWIDASNSLTIAEKGAKEVPVLTTGHDKMRVTVMLTARSDGFKCRPFVLLPRKRPNSKVVEKFKNKLQLCWEGTVWMNDICTSDYLQKIIGPSFFGKRLLAWDSFRCHMSESTKKKLKELQIDMAIIPGGCTKFIQAPDVNWNAPFKANIRRSYQDWMTHDDKPRTKGGNPAAPPMEVYLQWIVDAWEQLPKDLIIKSFKNCGLTIALDGSEDDQIHCFKPDGQIPNGQELLRQARLLERESEIAELLNEVDLAEDENNGYESDVSIDLN